MPRREACNKAHGEDDESSEEKHVRLLKNKPEPYSPRQASLLLFGFLRLAQWRMRAYSGRELKLLESTEGTKPNTLSSAWLRRSTSARFVHQNQSPSQPQIIDINRAAILALSTTTRHSHARGPAMRFAASNVLDKKNHIRPRTNFMVPNLLD